MLPTIKSKPETVADATKADANDLVEALARLYLDYGVEFEQALRITGELLRSEMAAPSKPQILN